MKPLRFLQLAWPVEVAVVIVFTMTMILVLPDRFGLWMQSIGPLAGLIAGQGAIAFGGPRLKAMTEARRAANGQGSV